MVPWRRAERLAARCRRPGPAVIGGLVMSTFATLLCSLDLRDGDRQARVRLCHRCTGRSREQELRPDGVRGSRRPGDEGVPEAATRPMARLAKTIACRHFRRRRARVPPAHPRRRLAKRHGHDHPLYRGRPPCASASQSDGATRDPGIPGAILSPECKSLKPHTAGPAAWGRARMVRVIRTSPIDDS